MSVHYCEYSDLLIGYFGSCEVDLDCEVILRCFAELMMNVVGCCRDAQHIDIHKLSYQRVSLKGGMRSSIAGVVCLPAFIEDTSTLASIPLLDLQEITMVPSLAFLGRCADACDSAGAPHRSASSLRGLD